MEWLGLLVSACVGGVGGLWLLGIADRLRCSSVGFPSAQEAALCPVLIHTTSWAHIPWERLHRDQPGRWQAGVIMLVGSGCWTWSWWHYWHVVPHMAEWVWHVVFLSVVLLFGITDLRWRVLPLEPIYGAAALFFFYRWLGMGVSPVVLLQGGAAMLAFFGVQTWVSRGRWLASGDPVLAGMIGIALGWPLAATATYFTYMSVFPLLIFVGWRVGTWRTIRLPFAPLLFVGAWCALVWGQGLVTWMRQ